jgi:hypothetical protein
VRKERKFYDGALVGFSNVGDDFRAEEGS